MSFRFRVNQVLASALEFPIDEVLLKYSEKTGYPAHVVEEHARELRRYLVMCAVADQSLPMAGPVDELWHEFMLHSQSYARFCEQVAGRYIHHVPATKAEPRQGADDGAHPQSWRSFRERYVEAFDEEPPPHIWPRADNVEVGSRKWWERRLDRVANGQDTKAFLWWSSSDSSSSSSTSSTSTTSTTGDIAQCSFDLCASSSDSSTTGRDT